jgi:hypothetical protein
MSAMVDEKLIDYIEAVLAEIRQLVASPANYVAACDAAAAALESVRDALQGRQPDRAAITAIQTGEAARGLLQQLKAEADEPVFAGIFKDPKTAPPEG